MDHDIVRLLTVGRVISTMIGEYLSEHLDLIVVKQIEQAVDLSRVGGGDLSYGVKVSVESGVLFGENARTLSHGKKARSRLKPFRLRGFPGSEIAYRTELRTASGPGLRMQRTPRPSGNGLLQRSS